MTTMDAVSGRSDPAKETRTALRGAVAVSADEPVSLALGRMPSGSGVVRGAFLAGSIAALAACTSTANMLPAPPEPDPQTGFVSQLAPYHLQVGDVLDVRLLLNPELNEEVSVRPDGHISTTVVQDEVAYNRTVPELAAALRKDYAKDLHNPRLSVVVKSFAPTRIYVGGEVTNPGEMINVGPTLTLSQAIARAGAHKVRGDADAIFIIRRGQGDVPQFFSVRYNDVIKGRDAAADVRLAPYDVVYVPKTGVAEVFDWFNQYFLQFVPVSWGFSYVVGNGGGGTTVIPTP
jgi:polysaccharide biosynthesis/export protein